MIYIQKLIRSKKQYSITIPKALVKATGIDKCRVMMVYSKDNKTITIEEYDASKARKSGL